MLAVVPAGATIAGVLTRSKTSSAPVDWCRKNLARGKVRAIVVNAGNANAFTGKAGDKAVEESTRAIAQALGCPRNEVFMASTGVIGQPLDWEKIAAVVPGAHQVGARGRLGRRRRRDHDDRHLPQARHAPGQDRRADRDHQRLPQGLGHDRARHGDHAGLRLHRRQGAERRAAEAAGRCRRQVAELRHRRRRHLDQRHAAAGRHRARPAMRRSRRPTIPSWSTSSARSTRC